MMRKYNVFKATLIAAMLTVTLTACSTPNDGIRSKALGIYLRDGQVVTADGIPDGRHSLDRHGNIIDDNGNVLVKSEKIDDYIPVSDGVFYFSSEGPPRLAYTGKEYVPVCISLELRIYPADSTETEFNLISSDKNLRVLDLSGESVKKIKTDINGSAYFKIQVLKPGKYRLEARSGNDAVADVEIKAEKMSDEESSAYLLANNIEAYVAPEDYVEDGTVRCLKPNSDKEAPPVTKQPQNITVKQFEDALTECFGDNVKEYSWALISSDYKIVLREEKSIEKAFGKGVIQGTDTNTLIIIDAPANLDGWLVQCRLKTDDYEVYSDCAEITVLQDETESSPDTGQPAAIIDEENFAPTHVHNYKRTYVSPTYSEYGKWHYICACGSSYEEINANDPPLTKTTGESEHRHRYEETVVAPTLYEQGYTHHECPCGSSYDDNFVSPLSYKNLLDTEKAEQEGNAYIEKNRKIKLMDSDADSSSCVSELLSFTIVDKNGGQKYLEDAVKRFIKENTPFGKKISSMVCRVETDHNLGGYRVSIFFS